MKVEIISVGILNVKYSEMVHHSSCKESVHDDSTNTEGLMRITMNAMIIDHDGRVVLVDPGCADFMPRKNNKAISGC